MMASLEGWGSLTVSNGRKSNRRIQRSAILVDAWHIRSECCYFPYIVYESFLRVIKPLTADPMRSLSCTVDWPCLGGVYESGTPMYERLIPQRANSIRVQGIQ